MKLIVEPYAAGHRLYYVALLLKELMSRGEDVTLLTTSTTVESAEWQVHLSAITPAVLERPLDEFNLTDIAAVSASVGSELTIIPNADAELLPVIIQGWRGPGALKLLVMRAQSAQPGPPFPRLRPLKTLVKRALIRAADLRSSVDVYALRNPLSPPGRVLNWVPDPIVLNCTPQQQKKLEAQLDAHGDRYWFGVFGAICPRKNLPLIAAAIADQQDCGLVIAGSVADDVAKDSAPFLEAFTANGGAVIQLPGPLTAEEFDSAIATVDCVIVAQSEEGSSSIVLRAAALGRRLIVAGAKSLKKDASYLPQHAEWCRLEVDVVRTAMSKARFRPQPTLGVRLETDQFVRSLT
ncbi:MAG TPA: hypothetical protein PLK04_10335 [Bacillota bacterium]|nr:hypothetical protein [Bacillota bacterium]